MLNGLSLKAKLLLQSSFMALIIVTISVFAYLGLDSINTSNKEIVDEVVPSLAIVNSMGLHYKQVRIEVRTLGLAGISKTDSDHAIERTINAIKAYEDQEKAYSRIRFTAGEQALYEQLKTDWAAFKQIGVKAISLSQSTKPEDREALTKLFLVDCPASAELYNKSFEALATFNKNSFAKISTDAKNVANEVSSTILVISIVGTVVSLVVGFLLATKLSNTIRAIVQSLKGSTDEVANASVEIAASSEKLSRATSDQAASLQETSSSIEEINSMINANNESAQQSAKSSERSFENAEKGQLVVGEMIVAIEKINSSNSKIMDQIDESNKEIESIVKLISEIGNKTKVINDIVFQTKLLSFNASVEAARAGENGKGFAVVAEEVGKLASMSGTAALEITNMLDSSISKVETIVKNSKERVGKLVAEGKVSVEKGTSVANQCGEVLKEIVLSVGTVSNAVAEISNASQEQAQGVQEVTKAIALLDQVTQENSTNSANSAEAATSLSNQAATLSQLVEELVYTVDGVKKNSVQESSTSSSSKSSTIKIEKKVVIIPKKGVELFPAAQDSRFSDV